MHKGKKYVDSAKTIDRTKQYDPAEALSTVVSTAKAKFDETIELHVKLGVDSRHADQQVRGAIALPHGTGKTQRVLVFAKGDKAEAAKAAGAQARAELDAPTYEPSIFKRFPDEPARYDYLFTALHERGAELVPEDAAFMEYFENTPQFQRNFKPLYDGKLELLHRQSNIATA